MNHYEQQKLLLVLKIVEGNGISKFIPDQFLAIFSKHSMSLKQ